MALKHTAVGMFDPRNIKKKSEQFGTYVGVRESFEFVKVYRLVRVHHFVRMCVCVSAPVLVNFVICFWKRERLSPTFTWRHGTAGEQIRTLFTMLMGAR